MPAVEPAPLASSRSRLAAGLEGSYSKPDFSFTVLVVQAPGISPGGRASGRFFV